MNRGLRPSQTRCSQARPGACGEGSDSPLVRRWRWLLARAGGAGQLARAGSAAPISTESFMSALHAAVRFMYMRTDVEARPHRTPILRRAVAGIVVVLAGVLAISL